MSKAISYSLFGYGKEKHPNGFTFDTYLVGLMLSIRLNRLVFPDWENVLETDNSTYTAFEPLFKYLADRNILQIEQNPDGAKLCEAMLWRLKPAFWVDKFGKWEFSHVLCRDLDSLHTYREAQAVQVWINNDKAMHAITDSVSHDVYLLGGMIGIRPDHFTSKTNIQSFSGLMSLCNIDLSAKGSDQTFLNSVIYPMVGEKGHDSITQHYFKGRGPTWLSDFHSCNCWLYESTPRAHRDDCPENTPIPLDDDLKETNDIAWHMGQSGWNQPHTLRIIEKHRDKFADLEAIEKEYKQIFYWIK